MRVESAARVSEPVIEDRSVSGVCWFVLFFDRPSIDGWEPIVQRTYTFFAVTFLVPHRCTIVIKPENLRVVSERSMYRDTDGAVSIMRCCEVQKGGVQQIHYPHHRERDEVMP